MNKLLKVISKIPAMPLEVGRLVEDEKEAREEMKRRDRKRMWLSNTNPLPEDTVADPLSAMREYADAVNRASGGVARNKDGPKESIFKDIAENLRQCNYVCKRRLF